MDLLADDNSLQHINARIRAVARISVDTTTSASICASTRTLSLLRRRRLYCSPRRERHLLCFFSFSTQGRDLSIVSPCLMCRGFFTHRMTTTRRRMTLRPKALDAERSQRDNGWVYAYLLWLYTNEHYLDFRTFSYLFVSFLLFLFLPRNFSSFIS